MTNTIDLKNAKAFATLGYADFKSYTIVLKAHADCGFRGNSIEEIYYNTQTGVVTLVMTNYICITSAFGQDAFFCVDIEDQRFEYDTYEEAVEFAQRTIWA